MFIFFAHLLTFKLQLVAAPQLLLFIHYVFIIDGLMAFMTKVQLNLHCSSIHVTINLVQFRTVLSTTPTLELSAANLMLQLEYGAGVDVHA